MTDLKFDYDYHEPPPASAFGEEGMTRREYFAAHAPPAIARGISELSDRNICDLLGIDSENDGFDHGGPAAARRALQLLAKRHYEYADEMLKAAAPSALLDLLQALKAIERLDVTDVEGSFWKARNLARFAANLVQHQVVGQ